MPPDVSGVVTEDDTPVDNFPSEKQQRLLTEPLYSSWSPGKNDDNTPRSFLAAANVGLFATPKEPAIVPDVMLSLDVTLAEDWWKKENRSYFVWELGKPPDIVIEIVSNREGNELGAKRRRYEWLRVPYYVVWDPSDQLRNSALQAFELRGFRYSRLETPWFEDVGLGLTVWDGLFEGRHDQWLRWRDANGLVIPTGAERAEVERSRADMEHARAETERERADAERSRAETERSRADTERQRAERLAAKLAALGVVLEDA